MADQLFLSVWFPNFRVQSLPGALVGVLRQFATIAQADSPPDNKDNGLGRVAAASAFPIDWTESPFYQRIYVNDKRAESSADTEGSIIENAVAEATEQMHDDSAYEFEMRWMLWLPEAAAEGEPTTWKLQPGKVRIVGFGPQFDEGSYEQNGHIRVDFGLDTPWVLEDDEPVEPTGTVRTGAKVISLGKAAVQEKIKQNVEKLLAFTLSVEKHCGISSRLLWTESGEPLAEKLIARLQRLN